MGSPADPMGRRPIRPLGGEASRRPSLCGQEARRQGRWARSWPPQARGPAAPPLPAWAQARLERRGASPPRASGLAASPLPALARAHGGGWQQWLSVAAALGFQADPGAWPDGVNTGAAASAASSEAHVQDRRASAPGATSAPVVVGSARRRGGRAPRPPAAAPAPASEHIDLTDDRCDSSDSEMDHSDSSDDDEWTTRTLAFIRSVQNNLFATAIVASKYFMTYHDKKDARIPEQSGFGWTMEILNAGESYEMFRMDETLFYKLHDLLVSNYGLQSSLHIHSIESIAIFLLVCGHGTSNGACSRGIFKHSSETISRKFEEVLNCMVGMSRDYIRPIDPNFSRTHQRIRNDRRMMPYFRDCIGALDGTHISATPLPKDLIRYIGRSGKATQNVLAVVDFDMQFTYASIGQPGSMHDTNVLFHALRHDQDIFLHPPQGKYYLVDAGYPNRPGYLAPYRGERYHVPDWRTGPAPRGEQELFNHLHSSLRNVVERSFGVLKMKWRVLKMPSYPMDKQKMIVAATMCLHNYIRENSDEDEDFRKCDRDPDYVPTIPKRYRRQNAGDTSTSETDDRNMDKFRDDLARAIFLARSSSARDALA